MKKLAFIKHLALLLCFLMICSTFIACNQDFEINTETESEMPTESESTAKSDALTESESESETETKNDTESETDTETDTETETGTDELCREPLNVSGKPDANVIIVSGQSNAYGATPITDQIQAEAEKYDFSNVYIKYMNINCDSKGLWRPFYNNEAFELYRLGIGAEGTKRIGPEFGIVCYLIDQGYVSYDKPLYIIKYTAAATVLNSQWLPSNKKFTSDSNALVSDLGGHLSDLMGDYIYEALKEISETHTPIIQSFFWIQGESDAQNFALAGGYASAEQELIKILRNDFKHFVKDGGISFVNYAIQKSAECGFTWTYASTVNNAKKKNCEYIFNLDVSTSIENNMVKNDKAAISDSVLVMGDNFFITKKAAGEDNNDHYHLSSRSMYELGRAMGSAMLYLSDNTLEDDPIMDGDDSSMPEKT